MDAIETMNMMSIDVKKFTKEIKMDFEDGNYDPIVGLGKSGIGKTMCIAEICEELGIGFCELRLVTMTEIDILGLPKEDDQGRTTYAANALLPRADIQGKRGILVLDEITSASPTVRAAAFQLLDSKRALGEYKLPDEWKVVALGNGISDGGVFNGIEAAFLSRCTCYRVEPNAKVWIEWAIKHEVNPAIVAFIQWKNESLHVFNPDEMAAVFPCPRSWTTLSKRLSNREKRLKDGESLDKMDVEFYAAGTVGASMASMFAGFYSYKGKTLSPEDIMSGKADPEALSKMKLEAIHLTIQSLVKQLGKELKEGKLGAMEFKPEVIKRTANTVKWAIGSNNLDYAIMVIQGIASATNEFTSLTGFNDEFQRLCPEFDKFVDENEVIFG